MQAEACTPTENQGDALMVWLILGVLAAALLSLFFSTMTYSLRDYSRPKL
jgi:hypothetical protein